MCGIFGILVRPGKLDRDRCFQALNQMTHRGPDAWGLERFTVNDNWEVWLGQRRLSILDLSNAANQPMRAGHGALVFNGEIYNHAELSKEIGPNWRFVSRSDTEVLLAGLLTKGTSIFSQLNGMMALGFLDLSEQRLLLARDRVGKKPLYIYNFGDTFAFASELKPFVQLGLSLTVDETATAFYRWLGYVPGQMTIYKECKKLEAGSYLQVDLKGGPISIGLPVTYWDPLAGFSKQYKRSYSDAIEEFLCLLDDATRLRVQADVPVGVFLSGGIDSSLVATSLKKLGQGSVKAFTVKFSEANLDESVTAIGTAKKLGIEISLLHLRDDDFANQVNRISRHFDEPFSDSSQVPTLAIAEAARKKVTVVLTGDGGDEVFLGYPRYTQPQTILAISSALRLLPGLASIGKGLIRSGLVRFLLMQILSRSKFGYGKMDSKINRFCDLLDIKSPMNVYDSLLATCPRSLLSKNDQSILPQKSLWEILQVWYPSYSWGAMATRSFEEKLSAIDFVLYLRDDVLVKVDRATMAYSLEARSPLLDYRIVEFGQSLPFEYKVSNGVFKKILRDALEARLPGSVSKLKKRGFGVELPGDLPPGLTTASRWNLFVEQEWRRSRNLGN